MYIYYLFVCLFCYLYLCLLHVFRPCRIRFPQSLNVVLYLYFNFFYFWSPGVEL